MSHPQTGSYVRIANSNQSFDFILTRYKDGILKIILGDATLGLQEVVKNKKDTFYMNLLKDDNFEALIGEFNNVEPVS